MYSYIASRFIVTAATCLMAATSDPLIHTMLLGVFGFALAVMDSNPFTIIESLSPDDSTRGYFIGPPPLPPALARLTHRQVLNTDACPRIAQVS